MKLILVFCFFISTVSAELSLSKSLSDDMVFQRNQPITLWGRAKVNQTVKATLENESIEVKSDSKGMWRLSLKPREASIEPHTINIISGRNIINLKNILIGDVWFCAGQSNMAYKVGSAFGFDQATSYKNNDQIRFLAMQRGPFTKPIVGEAAKALVPSQENKDNFYKINGWKSSSTKDIKSLAAVAYWFAQKVQQDQNIPIGLIVPPVGGSAVQAWVSRSAFETDPNLKPLLECWIQDEPERLQKQLLPWLKSHPGAKFDDTPLHRHRPTTLFETAVQPMKHHAIKGVLWYQGEQNAQNEIQSKWHEKSFPHLIKGFRENWKQPDLPFYYVQLPGFGDTGWPIFREQQRRSLNISNTAMAVAIDLGDEKNIHPKDKRPIGERLARLALKNSYSEDIVADSPYPESIKVEGDKVIVTYGGVGAGLKSAIKEIPHFELAGSDENFQIAEAKIISKNQVSITVASVNAPVHIRYAWKPFPRPLGLVNSADLPAVPFSEKL